MKTFNCKGLRSDVQSYHGVTVRHLTKFLNLVSEGMYIRKSAVLTEKGNILLEFGGEKLAILLGGYKDGTLSLDQASKVKTEEGSQAILALYRMITYPEIGDQEADQLFEGTNESWERVDPWTLRSESYLVERRYDDEVTTWPVRGRGGYAMSPAAFEGREDSLAGYKSRTNSSLSERLVSYDGSGMGHV